MFLERKLTGTRPLPLLPRSQMMDSTRCSETGVVMSAKAVVTFVAAVAVPTAVKALEVAAAVVMVAAGEETIATQTREVPPLAPLARRTSKYTELATA